jgi:hypothetical protein
VNWIAGRGRENDPKESHNYVLCYRNPYFGQYHLGSLSLSLAGDGFSLELSHSLKTTIFPTKRESRRVDKGSGNTDMERSGTKGEKNDIRREREREREIEIIKRERWKVN